MSGERSLNLADEAVLAMARANHVPAEVWTVAGELLSVHCEMCGHDWPCRTYERVVSYR